eukprot:TRINITY_DN3227_c0_g1_i1.p1 TRINITY_DN3227_c0_g1~~TRINITY_DN3227_c0_g1_i1.p1  ORF type:complete len:204 (-),score=33.85 TRINITY_DN3227_c0_g1_i1:271-882(-)
MPHDDIITKMVLIYSDYLKNQYIGPVFCEEEYECYYSGSPQVDPFMSIAKPSISVSQYIQRVAIYSKCSASAFIGAGIFIDRILRTNKNFYLTEYNFHRLFVMAVTLAAKFFDDKFYTNDHYSKVGGICIEEFNNLELELLFLLKFSLKISLDEYESFLSILDQKYCYLASCHSFCRFNEVSYTKPFFDSSFKSSQHTSALST